MGTISWTCKVRYEDIETRKLDNALEYGVYEIGQILFSSNNFSHNLAKVMLPIYIYIHT